MSKSKDPNEIVCVNAKIKRGKRSDAVIASRKLGTTVSDIIITALEEAIAKAEAIAS